MKASRKNLLALAAVFILPVVLAYFALQGDWFNRGVTNKGTLVEPPLDLSVLDQPDDPKWRLLYVLPESCDKACNNALYAIHQVWLALGREQDRVEPLVLVPESEMAKARQAIKELGHIRLQAANRKDVNKVFKAQSANGIFIVDTLGQVILRYPLKQQKQQAVLSSRDILSDMKKLLKLSRIG
ncbi:hypothetical protein HMF8227_00079 [Saliniradius amylolyticus]|uniref:Uncharacterized protein n=1 Tax=Saliniradius amylolyticus TaxID=2183582 RepID=A0A2S2E0P6_9ALTE|nr:hypothetical protein [Saliniradius amylolyticus]AWL10587.1 hypothetical protein HMF8227_00079 [Saliniradius amylolyticus]